MSSISITTDRSRIDVDAALALLRQTYWATEMSRDTLAKAMAHSLCFGILRGEKLIWRQGLFPGSGEQAIGFAKTKPIGAFPAHACCAGGPGHAARI